MTRRLVWPAALPALPELNAEQAAVLAAWRGPVLALGGPGTGKTVLAVHAARAEVLAGGRPLVFARTRQAASHLRNLITAGMAGRAWQPAVTTVHAFARLILERFGDSYPRLLTAPEQEFRVRELLAGNPGRWRGLEAAITTGGFARQVRGVLARARQLGLDPEDLTRLGKGAGPAWEAIGGFFAEYLDVLDAEEVIDYAELVHRARILLPERFGEVSAVVVDDYPELDPSGLGLIAALGAKTLAVGDPNTVITAFRGAHPHAVQVFPGLFGGTVFELRQSYRSVDLSGVRSRLPVPVVAGAGRGCAVRAAAGGSAAAYLVGSEAQQAKVIAELLRQAELEGLGFADMAVLVRSAKRAVGPILRALARAGIPVGAMAASVPLAEAWPVRVLLAALLLAADGEVDAEQAELLLRSPLAGLDALGLHELLTAHQAVVGQPALRPGQRLVLALSDTAWLGQAGDVGKLQEFLELIAAARAALADGKAADEVAWALYEDSGWAAELTASQARRELEILRVFFTFAGAGERRPGAAGVHMLLAEIAAQSIAADTEREARPGQPGVEVLSVHQAKGRQWPFVIIAGVQEGAWPAVAPAAALIDPAQLRSDEVVPKLDAREGLAAERRLFYTACATAARRLVLLSVAGASGESCEPSRFIAELGLEAVHPPQPKLPVDVAGLVAGLRARAESPELSLGARQASARLLGELGVRSADPANWWGVRELSGAGYPRSHARLSPSQLGMLLECPRRFFLSREARADPPSGELTELGSMIHRLVADLERGELAAADAPQAVTEAIAQLPYEIAWQAAAHRDEAVAALERFRNWEAARPEAVGVEQTFEFGYRADGIELAIHGTVDRLERTSQGLRIVDFKSATRLPSQASVAGLEQLGVYQLAVEAGALGAGEASAGAELVFLRAGDVLPKQLRQESLRSRPHLEPGETKPTWVEHRLARAADILRAGEFPATPCPNCRSCAFAAGCPGGGGDD